MSFVGLAGAIAGVATSAGLGATAAGIIGGVGAGALGGAGLGALSSAITGGDIGKGALFGGLGGALTGGVGSAIGSVGGSAAGAGTGSAAGSTTGTAAGSAASSVLPSTTTVEPLMGSMFGAPSMTPGITPAITSGAPAITGGGMAAPIAGVPAPYTPPTLPMSPVGAGATPMPTPTFTPQALPAGLENLGTLSQADIARAGIQNSLFGQYATPIIGIGSMAGNYMASDDGPTQATPPMPYGGDAGALSYYRFNPRKYKPQAPGYTGYLYANPTATPAFKPAYYAEGGIASLNPNPDMMQSGPAQVDFMGADAYPTSQQKLNFYSTPSQMPTSAQQAVASYEPATNPLTGSPMANFARGGISDLGGYSDGGRMTKGPGDGMSDSIPASIAGKRPARLAQGEFVVPADVVSHLGNGSTDAGAKQLYSMMDRVRKARTGRKSQGKKIKPAKMMPA